MRGLGLGLLWLAVALAPSLAWAASAGTLKLEVVLVRHGVRSPTSAPEALGKYSRQPWPEWPVAPGVLTEHGAQGMQSLGARYRERYASSGLWNGRCDTVADILIVADSTPRNRDSAAAFGRGLGGDCALGYLAREQGQDNRLFHFQRKDGDDDDAATWPKTPAQLELLQEVLLGCRGETCRKGAEIAGTKLLLDGSVAPEALAKAMKTAGSLSENLMLEYAQGMPLDRVAWGRGGAATIGQLIQLHNLQFAASKKPLAQAQRSASNLLAHIVATLEAAAGRQGDVQPLADASMRAVILVGHDTNLAQVSGLLGTQWHSAAQPDDYPPGGAMVFQLWEDKGHYTVRVHALLPTLQGLREANLARADSLIDMPLAFGPCAAAKSCSLEAFVQWTSGRILPAAVEAAIPAMQHTAP
ncbi:MAG TPA: histidine-type phosphatase [Dyella sp.]|uniref:histidine-type phosphatase n=1 Tax=Dyella sp. TaxID=1869338 RepID=UPI002F931762